MQKNLPESSSSLLVHFCSWRHAIHRHEEDLAWLDDPEEHLQIVEDVCKNLLLRNSKVDILVIGMGALMNNSIHVKIEIVEFGNLKNSALKTTVSDKKGKIITSQFGVWRVEQRCSAHSGGVE